MPPRSTETLSIANKSTDLVKFDTKSLTPNESVTHL